MDWDNLRVFLELARAGSVRSAAKKLNINHSTVSRRLAAFEEQLGVRLFERLSSGYALTDAGDEMLATATQIETEVLGLERRLLGRDTRLSGEIKVTMPDILAMKVLMPALTDFGRRYPGIVLEVATSYEVFNLSNREADVAIRITDEPPDQLIGRRLLTLAKSSYASPEYLSRHDVENQRGTVTWIGWDDHEPHPQWIRESDFPEARTRGRINNPMLQLEAAKTGMGIAMLPCFVGDLDSGLRRIPPGRSVRLRDLWLLTHADLRATTRIKTFMSFIADAILAQRDLLEGRQPQS